MPTPRPAFLLLLLITLCAAACSTPQATRVQPIPPVDPPVATFSIVAHDPSTGSWGVAVQSKFIAVGAVVPYAQAGVGAVATQAWANPAYGPEGLALLASNTAADDTVAALTNADDRRALRQVGVVDAQGHAAAYTGDNCLDWAGHRVGEGYTVQGNILAGEAVLDAMATAFEAARDAGLASGDTELADWLLAALDAGQQAGGDRRGRQSAALYVARAGAGYGGTDRYRDLRVDDHPTPIAELHRILALHQAAFPPPPERD